MRNNFYFESKFYACDLILFLHYKKFITVRNQIEMINRIILSD